MQALVSPEDPKRAISAFDINTWRFGESDKKEDELARYLKSTLLVLNSNEEFDLLK